MEITVEPRPHPTPADNGFNAGICTGVFVVCLHIFSPLGPRPSVRSAGENAEHNSGGSYSRELVLQEPA